MPVHNATSVVWRGFLLVSALTIGVGAKVVQNPQPMPGYTAASAAAQRGIESEAVAVPSPTSAAEHEKSAGTIRPPITSPKHRRRWPAQIIRSI